MIYEILYILPSQHSDTEVEGVIASMNAMLEAAGAKVQKAEPVGKIKLAYPIKKQRHGTYVLTYIEADGSVMAKVDSDLKLSDNVIRHIIVKREHGIPATTFRPSSYQPPLTPEGKRSALATDRVIPATSTEAPKEGTRMTVEQLDKKLDEILDTDIGNV